MEESSPNVNCMDPAPPRQPYDLDLLVRCLEKKWHKNILPKKVQKAKNTTMVYQKVTNSTHPREAKVPPYFCWWNENPPFFGGGGETWKVSLVMISGPGDISSSERSSPTPGAQRYSPRWVGEFLWWGAQSHIYHLKKTTTTTTTTTTTRPTKQI